MEPNRLITPTPSMVRKLKQWQALLSTSAGVAAIRMVSAQPISPSTLMLTMYSDAMTETQSCGLGGWFHGSYWSRTLFHPYTLIPIAVLEFIAALTSIVTFAQLLPLPDSLSHTLHIRVDALSSPYILTEDAASSPAMIALHEFILAHSVYLKISPILIVSHVPGVGNELADAASRSVFTKLTRLASHLKLSASHVDSHPVLDDLLALALTFYV